MKPPGYENLAQRPFGYETSDGIAQAVPETRSGTMASRRASWQGRGRIPRGTQRQVPDAATLAMQTELAQTEVLRMRLRLLELGV
jgi:hypothetical protein